MTTQTVWRIAVAYKPAMTDAAARGLETQIRDDLGLPGIGVAIEQVYYLTGPLTAEEAGRIGQELLADPITQTASAEQIKDQGGQTPSGSDPTIEITYRPGVMDPCAASVLKGVRDLGIHGVTAVRTAKAYALSGASEGQRAAITHEWLMNPVIEMEVTAGLLQKLLAGSLPSKPAQVVTVPLRAASDTRLQQVSAQGQLSLTLEEMRAIQTHFRGLDRDPTDVELETLAQTWSEHCKHKTLRGQIVYTDETGRKRVMDDLLKHTVMRATEELAKPWCRSVFRDNAGVIDLDDQTCACVKVETHNHPSAIEPFGGANTGVGGVIRDVLGTGRGAKPIANTDVFCFAPPDAAPDRLPAGVLHPRRVLQGVVAGVRDYGNKMGIPTVNGAVLFDERFAGNPLVFCGTVGVLPRAAVGKSVAPGALVVVVGGRTGRDGIHGATFSSAALTQESDTISATAVQIGNPITEKTLADAVLAARDLNLFTAITDCGAGGLSSAVGELGADCGVRVDLERVPLKYEGLSYTDIWISESQERMVLAVPPDSLDRLLAICRTHQVEATAIGTFTDSKRLQLYFHGLQVADLDMAFLHDGVPRVPRPARWVPPTLLKLLARWDSCSKEPIIRRYDHEVQGGSALKPLVGAQQDGPSDAAIVRPDLRAPRGLIIANGLNVRYGDLDPYWMAAAAIDEALRQIVAVGGSLDRVALLDNFCWGDTHRPEVLGSLVRAALACYEFATAFGAPFVSGKDSLHNEYRVGAETHSIPGTLLISALGVMPDVTKAISMDLKAPGHLVYAVGATKPELGGSAYYALHDAVGTQVPTVEAKSALATFQALSRAMAAGLVAACHDCSEGGLGLAVAEMAFAGGVGATVALASVPTAGTIDRDDLVLFSESTSRFLVEVAKDRRAAFEQVLAGVPHAVIGETVAEPSLTIRGRNGQVVVQAPLEELKRAWQQPLEAYF